MVQSLFNWTVEMDLTSSLSKPLEGELSLCLELVTVKWVNGAFISFI